MEFPDLVSNGWQNHEKDTDAVARALEEHADLADDAGKAAQIAALVNHTLGEHLGDWERAVPLLERILTPLPRDAALVSPMGNLAVARFFAGDPGGAVATETAACALAGRNALGALVRIRMLLASGLLAADRKEECAAVYRATLDLAETLPEGTPADRAVAITSNNLASALIAVDDRSEDMTALMLAAAEAARTWWLRGGTWENDERADYLLALVHNACGRHEDALRFAARGLETIEKNGEEPVDEAFLRLTRAHAHRELGDDAAHARELAAAEELAAGFENRGLEEWFEAEATKVR